MKIGDEVYIHGYVDEIRYDSTKRISTIIIRNEGGYFGTVESEIKSHDLEREYEKSKALFSKVVKDKDCISRQAVLEVIRKCNCEGWVKADIGTPIEALQPVNPAEKVGRWEWVQYDANPEIGNFHCSECRYIPASFNMSAQKLNYCPNCGAKMAESEGN